MLLDCLTKLVGSLILLIAFWPMAVNARPTELHQSAIDRIESLIEEKANRSQYSKKLESRIIYTIQSKSRNATKKSVGKDLRTGLEPDSAGRILVDIHANVSSALVEDIKQLGGEVEGTYRKYQSIRAKLPLDTLPLFAKRSEVFSIRSADRAATHTNNTTEGDTSHGAAFSRVEYSVDGSGIDVCVLSDAIDSLSDLQTSGDLPPNITVLPGQEGSGGSEGTAMLEIIHDIAPGASLYFATAFRGIASFAQNILDMRFEYGCEVIVDDVFYFNESPFQDGPIAVAVKTVTSDGAVFFSSAGNEGNFNDGTSGVWEGDYVGSELPFPLTQAGLSAHSFSGRSHNTITADPPFGIALFWSDPLQSADNDYDLFLLNSEGTEVLAASTDIQNGTQDPFEYIDSNGYDDTGNLLVVVKYTGADRYFHLTTIRGKMEETTPGATKGHSSTSEAFSVAATFASGDRFLGGAANSVEDFSADGPRRMFFEEDGTPYTFGDYSASGGTVRDKPDITAADGVSTRTPGFKQFYGTSAAAPHAAAIAALMLDRKRDLTSANLRELFTNTAIDIEAPGRDRDSGVGIIMADLLLQALDCNPPEFSAVFTDVPCGDYAYVAVEAIFKAGITSGCDERRYCPFEPVTRAQIAIFLLRSLYGGGYLPPPASGELFDDVPLEQPAAAWIEQLARLGITLGCGGGRFCPNAGVTREQMAIFLLRAKYGAKYQPPPASGNVFYDVSAARFAAPWIEKLAEEGITKSCGGGNYCPDITVRRDQMALFLSRAFLP